MRTVLQDFPLPVKVFLAMEKDLYKNIVFERSYKNIPYDIVDIVEQDGKIYFGVSQYKVCRSSKQNFYFRPTIKSGFTYEKGKLKIWFGGSIVMLQTYFRLLFKHLGYSWLVDNQQLFPFITKGGLERILNGKITNPVDLCAYYMKSIRFKGSPATCYKAIKAGMSKLDMLRYGGVALYLDHYFEAVIAKRLFTYSVSDMITQAQQLEKKIDFTWTQKRMDREHMDWSFELMKAEMPHIQDEKVEYSPTVLQSIPAEFELLGDRRRVFEEGIMMRHCVYTNYWSSIQAKNFIAFHVKLGNEEATFGASCYLGQLSFGQCYGRGNAPSSEELIAVCKAWVDENRNLSLDTVNTVLELAY